MEIRLTAYGLDAWQRGLREAPAMAKKEMRAAAEEAVFRLQRDLQELPPGSNYPHDTGDTMRSIKYASFSTPVGVLGVVGSLSPVAAFLEFGTSRMRARPSFPAAWERNEHEIERIFENAAGRIAQALSALPGGTA